MLDNIYVKKISSIPPPPSLLIEMLKEIPLKSKFSEVSEFVSDN